MKRIRIILAVLFCALICAGAITAGAESKYAGMTAEEITAQLTLAQKAAQMVLPACYHVLPDEMQRFCYGGILSQAANLDDMEWREYTAMFQRAALDSDAGIPYIYGQDDVHGVNYCIGAVYFPHNIGLGAADDEDLMYRIGRITADEAKLCHMLWNYAPVVAQSVDMRWGRTYESYGADLDRITRLSTAYTKGLLDGGIVACPKHFFGDGNVIFGTGDSRGEPKLIDRGQSELSDEEIEKLLAVYQAQVDLGVQTIMVSFSSLNGVKMHENKEYIDRLKNEMGFKGFIVGDWEGVSLTSPGTYMEQVAATVNAGVDMLMEADHFREAKTCIEEGVKQGLIPEERVNDAVRRIIQVKMDAGILEDPLCENIQTEQIAVGSGEYRAVAEEAVEKSLVLLKNEGGVLPLKSGTAVYITGPAADHDQAQCGGWSVGWNGSPEKNINGVTSILEGFRQKADEYGIRVITKEAEASEADVVLLAVGEKAYAEWYGDTDDPDLCGPLGLYGNKAAMDKAKSYGKPVVTLIVAGRQVLISDYMDQWDAAVMCYLPGSEGQGIANVLCGRKPFTGKLPSPWYSSMDQLGTGESWLPMGYGLTAEE
ncbi:MAG: glycoside hydrolase family 3 protein [Clostridia bacterium]|nr:glycoside hydrolase family 3 protein [Clostridia bacterium]